MLLLIFLFGFLFVSPVFAESSVKISGYSATSPEYVELTNTTSTDINLDGWSIKDNNNSDDDILLTSTDIISANSTKKFTNIRDSGWLNDSDDIIYLYDNSSNQIDKLSYPTPTPTKTPTPTSTPTATPTPDPTVTNPTSGISLTEFLPYSDPEWIEIYNSNNYPVKLVSWKLEDKDAHTRNISTLSIGATSYAIFEYSAFFDNNNTETVILRNQDNTAISQMSYSAGLRNLDRSWSWINSNWCQSSITKGYQNVTSCYSNPTSTPTISITLTPTIDQSEYTTNDTASESAIIEPSDEPSFLSPSPQTTIASTVSSVLGDHISNNTNKNYLPLIFIFTGGLLLTSPLILAQIKKFKK